MPLANETYLAYFSLIMKNGNFILVQIVVRMFILLIILSSYSIAQADPIDSPLLLNKNTQYIVRLSLIHISEPTRLNSTSRMPSSA